LYRRIETPNGAIVVKAKENQGALPLDPAKGNDSLWNPHSAEVVGLQSQTNNSGADDQAKT
jgi:hypothetical protein